MFKAGNELVHELRVIWLKNLNTYKKMKRPCPELSEPPTSTKSSHETDNILEIIRIAQQCECRVCHSEMTWISQLRSMVNKQQQLFERLNANGNVRILRYRNKQEGISQHGGLKKQSSLNHSEEKFILFSLLSCWCSQHDQICLKN